MKIKVFSVIVLLLCTTALFPQKIGDDYKLYINSISLPLNKIGVLANVYISPSEYFAKFDDIKFLFSGGFFLSGYSGGELWANAVASASLVFDYLQGDYLHGQNDPNAQLYKLSCSDTAFGQSWQDWRDAVELGADFYDGDGDGAYNPVDLNGNGIWDLEEDSPDIIGDEMLWCVYSDVVPASQRRWNAVNPLGIEIRQSVFAYADIAELSNIIFIRYRIKYVGLGGGGESDSLNDVYFGVWSDPDIGDYIDDLVGCDTILNSGFTYNDGSDNLYGSTPPSFFDIFLSGPHEYIPGETFIDNNENGIYDEGIDEPIDTAYSMRGQLKGVTIYPGAKNLNVSSFVHYMQSHPELGDPDDHFQARNYMLGTNKFGEYLDPCTWAYGYVAGGIDCSTIDSLFWYSGDPVSSPPIGWINNYPTDQRQMLNVGPFTLNKDEEKEILTAYVVGRGSNALTSITEARNISTLAKTFFESNFDTLSIVSVKENQHNIPSEYSLSQNYPNPFNPATTISYRLPERTRVTLKVFDILGKEVTTLVNEEKDAGTYTINFDGSCLSSGVYFYTISAKNFLQTKKMLLIK